MQAGEARALGELLTSTYTGTVSRVEEMHRAIAARSFDRVGPLARPVRVVHDGIARRVYGTVRGVGRAVGTTGSRVVSVVPGAMPFGDGPFGALALGSLNGAVGDALEQQGSNLLVSMSVRSDGRTVPLNPPALAAAYPDATGKVVVFVHGLAESEGAWRWYARRHYGDRRTSYGTRLAGDLGYTPVYLRYNSGRHISVNGAALAELLDELVAHWPVPVDELALIGHSMGGLVVRSACAAAAHDERAWLSGLRHIVCLGAPHQGAPLEKGAHVLTWLLAAVPETRPLAEIARGRSAGIKDLRYGYLRDGDWRDRDPDASLGELFATRHHPTADGQVAHVAVGATLARDPASRRGRLIGDLLVRAGSATFQAADHEVFGGLHHLELLNHPDVYARIRAWLTDLATSPSTANHSRGSQIEG